METKHWTQVLEEWFNPESKIQMTAYATLMQTGNWPSGYYDTMPSQIQEAISQSNGLWTIPLERLVTMAYLKDKGYIK
jgi:hypothetical protein